jgi:hypothetical protein
MVKRRHGKIIKFLPVVILLLSFATAGYIVVRDWSSIPLFKRTKDAPAITSLEPSSGPVGTEVTVTGTSFAKTKNSVVLSRTGAMDGYIKNLESKDKKTLKFTIPEGLDLCSPEAEDNNYPCSLAHPRVTAGNYSISVLNENGESTGITFEVTE